MLQSRQEEQVFNYGLHTQGLVLHILKRFNELFGYCGPIDKCLEIASKDG